MCQEVSIVIPTYNRPYDLQTTIQSILKQSVIPKEIVVVDNANNLSTKQIISKFNEKSLDINFKYFTTTKNSSAIARNTGAENTEGDIILFLDDDVTLEPNFIYEIIKIYDEFPHAKCVQGVITNNYLFSNFWNNFHKLFLMWYFADTYTVLPSGKNTRTSNPNKIVNCQWASGSNLSIKRDIFKDIKFDENMIKYSFGEDKDFSYRIYKQYPLGIFQTPHARLLHKWVSGDNHLDLKRVIMEKTYTLYFISKNMNCLKSYLCFMWSELGILLKLMIFSIRGFSKFKIRELYYNIYSLYICVKYFLKIKNYNLKIINEKYLQ